MPLNVVGGYNKSNKVTNNKIDDFLDDTTSSEEKFASISYLFDSNFSMKNTDIEVARSIYKFG